MMTPPNNTPQTMAIMAPVDILLAGGPANSWLPQFAHTGWPGGTVALHWGHTVPIGEAEGCWFMILFCYCWGRR